MDNKGLLLLFVRAPELGKVKTRLAEAVGPEVALEIYIHLLQHTRQITEKLDAAKAVYFADNIVDDSMWPKEIYQHNLQAEGDLGQKMQTAFEDAFAAGYTSVVIIGSDCKQLTQEIIEQAFDVLKTHEIVIGPALDGGYYLLGMNKLYPELFQNKTWSTATVFAETIYDVERLHLSHKLLPELSDVDHVEDVDFDWLADS
ncbi:TIGR04282 family arsenosugar biosynthesis glycosyltransferase [Pontibacter sp. KCTC 32443]|uniref:TIGR04282 family arsenosugar biosynthesis glycosyltransferase n=1 Tax=Pontibacter TaxID=323449 RepID=UPI00164D2509|nr:MULTISPECIES: TIGR04282 family arsenosugar biosynthesis glycosyltransferase [Pontibacter]MBC5772911.1 TIGR04282 family arsenosugar biosynthesis glycosyltransferase [Pontibacter sp. KCTC 32443]